MGRQTKTVELGAGSRKEMGIWSWITLWSDDNEVLITGDNGIITIGAFTVINQNEVQVEGKALAMQ